MSRAIDVTPTWEGLMPALIAVLESGTAEGREQARAELMRLARAADAQIAHETATAEQIGQHYQAILWSKDRDGHPVTVMVAEGEPHDVAAYALAGHHPATAGIAEHGTKLSEAAARSYGASWPITLTYRR